MTKRFRLPAELPAAEMAELLSITPRRLQALAARGTLPKIDRNSYPTFATAHAYGEHLVATVRTRAGSPAADRLRDARRMEIERRMQREDRGLIQLDEAVEALQEFTEEMLRSVDSLPALIARNRQERRQVAPIVAAERDRLAKGFAQIADKLRTGADEPEDDE